MAGLEDVTCIFHGLKFGEHDCLVCCTCYETTTLEECNTLPDGTKEDVCIPCADLVLSVRRPFPPAK